MNLLLLLAALGVAAPHQAQDQPTETKIDASRGGVTFSSGVNSLTISGRLQTRWTLDDREGADEDTAGSGAGREDGPFSAFDVPRARVTLSGGALRPWLRYQLQVEMSRTGGEGGSRLKDAVIEIRPTTRPYRVLLGQFKAPFGLQQLTSSGRLQFVDRAITDSKFAPGRDMGILFGGTARSRTLGYEVGAFNGAGESVRQNTQSHLWAARVFVNPLGVYSLGEGAVDAATRPVVHVGAGVRGGKQIRGRTPGAIVEEADPQTAANVEFAFRAARVFTTAEYFWMSDEQENPVRGRDIESRGFHAQAGYMVVPRRVEVGLLLARIDGDTEIDRSDIEELRGVIGYFWQSHNLKMQADVGRLTYDERFAAMSSRARQGLPSLGSRLVSGRSLEDLQVRVQFQVAF